MKNIRAFLCTLTLAVYPMAFVSSMDRVYLVCSDGSEIAANVSMLNKQSKSFSAFFHDCGGVENVPQRIPVEGAPEMVKKAITLCKDIQCLQSMGLNDKNIFDQISQDLKNQIFDPILKFADFYGFSTLFKIVIKNKLDIAKINIDVQWKLLSLLNSIENYQEQGFFGSELVLLIYEKLDCGVPLRPGEFEDLQRVAKDYGFTIISKALEKRVEIENKEKEEKARFINQIKEISRGLRCYKAWGLSLEESWFVLCGEEKLRTSIYMENIADLFGLSLMNEAFDKHKDIRQKVSVDMRGRIYRFCDLIRKSEQRKITRKDFVNLFCNQLNDPDHLDSALKFAECVDLSILDEAIDKYFKEKTVPTPEELLEQAEEFMKKLERCGIRIQ